MQQMPNVPHGQARLDGDLGSLVHWKVPAHGRGLGTSDL